MSARGEPQRLELLPATTPDVRKAILSLDQLAGFENARPGRTLTELIRRLGVLEPIVVAPGPDGRYRVVEGRRRAKSVQLLAAEAGTKAQIPAVIVNGTSSERGTVLAGLALALHAGRSDSPSSELQAIETILEADRLSGEASTVSAIAAQTGMSTQTIRRRLKLRRLSPTLRAAFEQGEITTTAAEAAARLTADQQAQLERTLADTGRLTVDAVRATARARTSQAALELPDALFAAEATPWQPILRGHLQAALDAMPAGAHHWRLAEAIAAAQAEAEQSDEARTDVDEPRSPGAERDRRLVDELERTAAHLHREGCGDGAAAVDEAIRRLTAQEARR